MFYYDLYNPSDIEIEIAWNDSEYIESIYYNDVILTEEDYKINEDILVIYKEFLEGLISEEEIHFQIEFNYGAINFTVLFIDSTPKKYTVIFREENELDGIEIDIFLNGEIIDSIFTIEGVAEYDLYEGDYSFVATFENYRDYEEIFKAEEDVIIIFKMIEKQGNLLQNPYFEEWEEDKPNYWTSSHNQIKLSDDAIVGNYSMNIEHDYIYSSGRDDDQIFFYNLSGEEEVTFYAELWVKGYGDLRIGIRAPGDDWGSGRYGNWVEINSEEWDKIIFERKYKPSGTEGEFRIRHRQSGDKEDTNLIIGATWISVDSPPEGWPY